MRQTTFPTLCLSLLLACAASVAEARWFQASSGRSELRQIARTLAATPDGEVSPDSGITRPPEPPVPPPQATRRTHSPALTAEAAKSAAFSGPAEGTALIEVGLEADKAKAAGLAPEPGGSLESPTGDLAPQPNLSLPPPGQDESATPAEPAGDAPAAEPVPEAPFVFP